MDKWDGILQVLQKVYEISEKLAELRDFMPNYYTVPIGAKLIYLLVNFKNAKLRTNDA